MPIEFPVLRLGLAGFSEDQQERLGDVLANAASGGMAWQLGMFTDADAWWVNGSRARQLPDGTLRVASGTPAGRSIQIDLPGAERPVAFSVPIGPGNFDPLYRFDIDSLVSMHAILAKFEAWLRPVTAQFALASQLLENESGLGSGIYHVIANGRLLAVVDLQGEVGVLPTAGPIDFDDAMWTPRPAAAGDIPETFVRTSLSQLVWQYAVRTGRDLLPKRYRSGLLYFRRPPRLPQRCLKDSHLLLLRELAVAATSLQDLQKCTGLSAHQLAQDLAALYLVGAITSNPKRAAPCPQGPRRSDAPDSTPSLSNSVSPSELDSQPGATRLTKRPKHPDLTAPAPMRY